MDKHEYARKVLAALQAAGLVPQGVGDFTHSWGPNDPVAYAPGDGYFTVHVGPTKDGMTFTGIMFSFPEPPISPTARALKELKA